MFKRIFLALLLLTGTLGGLAPQARAQNVQTLDRILPEIRRAIAGNMSDAEMITGPDGQTRYRIKWVTPDGRIIWIEADARTGRILSQTGGGGERPSNQQQPNQGNPRARFGG